MRSAIISLTALGTVLLIAGCSAGNGSPPTADGGDGALGKVSSALTDSSFTLDLSPDLANPERGVAYWYGSAGDDPYTVSNTFLWLGDQCDVDLTWVSPANASPILQAWASKALDLKAQGKKAIFRPRYDLEGAEGVKNRCGKFEADSYVRMQNHVQAIAKMLSDPAIKPAVAFVEIGYLGSWGEWNAAGDIDAVAPGRQTCGTNWDTCDNYSPVLLAGLDGTAAPQDRITFGKYVIDTYQSLGVARPVGLRRPQFHNDLKVYYSVPETRMGFYNDCFMDSPFSADDNGSDGGTFVKLESDYNQPSAPTIKYPASVLSPQSTAKSAMRAAVAQGTQGGESCAPSNTSHQWYADPASVPGRMDLDGFHYFHPGTRNASDFRGRLGSAADATYGNVWNAVKSQLGYRFHAASVTYPASVRTGASMTLSAAIQNSGFAKFPNDRTAYFVLRGSGGNYVVGASNPKADAYTLIAPTSQVNEAVRSWNEDVTTTFSQAFSAPPPGTYTVHLYIPDPDCVASNSGCADAMKEKYAVKLATKRSGTNVFDSSGLGINNLGVSVVVTTNGCAGAGNVIQNCGFDSGMASFSCGFGGTATGSCSVVAGELQTIITSPGTAAYHVQPNQQSLSLTNGATYTVSFDARASVARSITVSVSMNHTPFSSYSSVRTFNITTSTAPYTFTFPMSQPSDSNVKLEFGLGAQGNNTVYLDNIVLRP